MEREITKLVQQFGMDRLQAYYHIRTREELTRRGMLRSSHMLK